MIGFAFRIIIALWLTDLLWFGWQARALCQEVALAWVFRRLGLDGEDE